ncbi:MAG: SurA N-terminal domain-containing protein [Caldimicrobium sp.]
MKKFFVIIIFLFIWVSPLFAGKIVNKIVAVVGDEVLTLYELDKMAEPFYKTYFKPGMDPLEIENLKKQIRKEVLDQWIEDTLIGLEAKKYNIKVTDEEIDYYIKENFKNANSTLEDKNFREKIRDQLMKIKFIQLTVREKIAIPEEELKEAYKELVKNYDPEPKYELEILIVKEELLVKDIYEEILQGRSFDAIVKNYRDQTNYFKEVFKEKELDPKILEGLKNLKPGEVLPPQKRGEVFQIIRLLKRASGTPPTYEEVKEELYEKLFQKKAQSYIEKWIKDLKESKFIKIYI